MDRPNNGLIMVYQSNEECGFRGSVRGLGGCAITYIIFLQVQKFLDFWWRIFLASASVTSRLVCGD